ncbi:MAG: branched-chain amino acid ABC transporter permease [Solirubrobacterales bacterium]|nr:branched-chain amino acid ABC transporter permease [Solirubrobacterales bacterium]OJU95666.1 MAG: branched-chain amino acid ABC transporter permease [Solirubrobacterales bacterium 67-14]
MLQHIFDAAATGSLYAVIALGIALVFGVMRLVNFAYGELLMVGGYVVLLTAGLPWPLIVACTLAAVGIVAFLMERIAFRPVREADPTTMLITSFAVSILLQNIAVWIAGRRPKGVSFGSSLSEPVDIAGASVPIVEPVTLGVVAASLILFVFIMRKTELGVQMRAAAEDFRMARLMGVRADSVIVAAFVASGVLAAIAALLLVATTGSVSPYMGLQPVLIGFVATVIGGMGSLIGAAVGGFALGAVTVLLQVVLPESVVSYRDAFVFSFVILVLLAWPQGLFANRAAEERV